MSKAFAIPFTAVTVSGAQTLIWVNPGVSRGLKIVEAGLSQHSSTTSAIQRVQLVTQVSAFPTLTTGVTPVPLTNGESSVISSSTGGGAGTAGIDASGEGAGAKTILWEDAFNIVNGNWRWPAGGENGIVLPASATFGFGLYLPHVAGGGSLTMSGYLHFVELG